MRPNFMAVGGWDGMQLIAKGLEASKGQGGEALLEGMKHASFESPRGPVSIDPATREIVQNMYVRKVEKVNGVLFNVEFDTLAQMKDPAKK
jgi:branched-chain amino acid transport system substrate-binding protein